VPEAAIYKNRQPLFAENEIRISKQRQMSPPACDFMLTEDCDEAHFRCLVPFRANRSHDL
jgi:hypothetical protein